MHWLALQWPQPEPGQTVDAPSSDALAWWALGFTPHVVWLQEALLMEVSVCERLWGGRRALLERVIESNPAPVQPYRAQAATSLVALARLRCQVMECAPSRVRASLRAGAAHQPFSKQRPVDLPLHALSAARPHLGVLARLGCRTWGELAALPRAGLARRFGPELGRALDIAFGHAPDTHAWITPPDRFEQSLELPQRADSAPALLWSARRLLQALQHWLAARQLGVLGLQLAWTFDQRRLDGRALPPEDAITLRTAEGVQGMAHLQRLLAERLARTPLLAPARAIRLSVLEAAPWQPLTPSFLPEDQPRGDPLHVFIERVSARLGAEQVRVPVPHADHRPERRQSWQSAEHALHRPKSTAMPRAAAVNAGTTLPSRQNSEPSRVCAEQISPWPDALSPTWLLRPPQPLALQDQQPCHQGQRLRLITGPHRVEAGWWVDRATSDHHGVDGSPVARDYFIAQTADAQLLWIYRERPTSASKAVLATRAAAPNARHAHAAPAPRWFLQGLYA